MAEAFTADKQAYARTISALEEAKSTSDKRAMELRTALDQSGMDVQEAQTTCSHLEAKAAALQRDVEMHERVIATLQTVCLLPALMSSPPPVFTSHHQQPGCRFDGGLQEKSTLTTKTTELESVHASTRAQLLRRQEDNTRLHTLLNEANATIDELRQQVKTMSERRAELSSTAGTAEDRAEQASRLVELLQAEKNGAQQEVDAMVVQVRRVREEINTVRSELVVKEEEVESLTGKRETGCAWC